MSNWDIAVKIAAAHGVFGRIKTFDENLPEHWQSLFIPTGNYIETTGTGPVPFRQVEWLDIQTSMVEHRGRLIPERVHDKSTIIISGLHAAGVNLTVQNGFVRVLPSNL